MIIINLMVFYHFPQPLFDEDVFVVHLFPPRKYAALLMSSLGWLIIIVLSAFIGMVMIQHSLPRTPFARLQQQHNNNNNNIETEKQE